MRSCSPRIYRVSTVSSVRQIIRAGGNIDLPSPERTQWASRSERYRFDQAGVVVLDAADASAHRPASHALGRIGHEKGFELAQIRWLFSKPDLPSFRPQHHRHPIVQLRT